MQNFPASMFYVNTERLNMEHKASNNNVEEIVGDVDDQSLGEVLESCKHFLTDTKMEVGRHRVFNFAMPSFY